MRNGKNVECSFSWAEEASDDVKSVLNIFYQRIPTLDATAEQAALLMASEITGLVQQVSEIRAEAESGGNGEAVPAKKVAREDWEKDSCAADEEDVDTICDEHTFLHTQGYSDESRAYLKSEREELTRKTVQIIQEDGQWADAVREAARDMLEEAHEAGSIESIEP